MKHNNTEYGENPSTVSPKGELIAHQKPVFDDDLTQLCAYPGCDNDADEGSCYCTDCEEAIRLEEDVESALEFIESEKEEHQDAFSLEDCLEDIHRMYGKEIADLCERAVNLTELTDSLTIDGNKACCSFDFREIQMEGELANIGGKWIWVDLHEQGRIERLSLVRRTKELKAYMDHIATLLND